MTLVVQMLSGAQTLFPGMMTLHGNRSLYSIGNYSQIRRCRTEHECNCVCCVKHTITSDIPAMKQQRVCWNGN